MAWQQTAAERLSQFPLGYHARSENAAEVMALAAVALHSHGEQAAANQILNELAALQNDDGSVGPIDNRPTPGWPTALALYAAAIIENTSFNSTAATHWLLNAAGKPQGGNPGVGHNAGYVGWSWAAGTHSWVEPTAWSVMALAARGLASHARAIEGRHLLVDRLLETGGCNYGNTVVLGQRLRPHVEPSGLTMLALAGLEIHDIRLGRTLDYLESALAPDTTPISLSYGLLGLAAHNRPHRHAERWLTAAADRVLKRDSSPHALALLLWAANPTQSSPQAHGWQSVGLRRLTTTP